MSGDRPSGNDATPLTMRDVAARIGVSPMTVSRALRGDVGVGKETRERVLAEVRSLGYRPNDLARRLRRGRSHKLVGLVVTNLGNPFYAQLALGAEEVAAQNDARIMLGNTGGSLELEQEIIADLEARGIDGLIVVPATSDHGHLVVGGENAVPVVLATSPPVGIDADCVLVDDFGGTRQACRQLIEQGHTRIGFLGLPASLWTGSERFRGYAAAMAEAGLNVDHRYVSQHPGDIALSYQDARAILELPDPPTALITANNRNTIGALRAVRDAGARIAISGFDEIEVADLLELPVSTIAYDPRDVGRAAARLLIDQLSSGATAFRAPTASDGSQHRSSRRITIPTHLVQHPRSGEADLRPESAALL